MSQLLGRRERVLRWTYSDGVGVLLQKKEEVVRVVVMVVIVKKSAEVFRGRRLKLELELGLSPLPLGSHFSNPPGLPP